MGEAPERQRSFLRETLDGLREGLRLAIENDIAVDPSEQLGRDAFVIEYERREEIESCGNARVSALVQSAEDANVRNELLACRVREICWNTHSKPGIEVEPFDSGAPVSNFPEVRPSEAARRRANHVAFLRRVELAEEEARGAESTPLGGICTEGGAAMSIGSARSGSARKRVEMDEAGAAIGELGAEEEEEERDAHGGQGREQELAARRPSSLLYHALALYTPARRAAQCELLAERSAELKATFNERCEAVLEEKRQAILIIEERAERCREVAKELGTSVLIAIPSLCRGEDSEQVLTVRDEEVTVEKVLTQAELLARVTAERAEADRLARAAVDDAPRRALEDMMGGRLERRKEDSLECQREDWMELPTGHLTKEQLKQLHAYEEAVRLAAEAEEKAHKALEIELRTLRGEMHGVREAFDESLRRLACERLCVEQDLKMEELMAIRLSRSIAELNTSRAECKNLSTEAEYLSHQRALREELLLETRDVAENLRVIQEDAAAEDKVLERAFKREFCDADEYLDLLVHLFHHRGNSPPLALVPHELQQPVEAVGSPERRKSRPRGESSGTSPNRLRAASMARHSSVDISCAVSDYAASGERMQCAPATSPPPGLREHGTDGGDLPLDASQQQGLSKCPKGLQQSIWERFMEYRATKVTSEHRVAETAALATTAQQKLAAAHEEDEAALRREDGIAGRLAAVEANMRSLLYDFDMWFELKQGQVEVDQAAVVTDYSDAMVLDVDIIQQLNTEIEQKGLDKVAILEQFKAGKSEMYHNEWLNKRADLQLENLDLKIKELQLLRVTRGLQTALKSSEDKGSELAAEETGLTARFSELENVQMQRVASKERKLSQILKVMREKREENSLLASKTSSAETVLEERQRVTDDRAQTTPTGSTGGSRRRIRNIMTNSRLLEISKQQMDEQAFLINELERLRRRSYPAFPAASGFWGGSRVMTAPQPPPHMRREPGTTDTFARSSPFRRHLLETR